MLEPAVERAPAEAERLRRLAHVAAVARRAPSGSAAARPPRAAGPRARGAAAGRAAKPEIAGADDVARAPSAPRARCAWSSSRMLPGHACSEQRLAAPRASKPVERLPVARRRSAGGSAAASARDVLAPLAQRRQPDLDRVEAEEQVLAEPARGDLARAGRRWWPRGCARRPAARATRRRARPRRSAARAAAWPAAASGMLPISSRNSVPPSASSKRPMRSVSRVGEGALHVAEQLALEDALGEPAQVDGDERPRRARRGGVDPAAPRPPCRCRARR